MKVIKIKKLKNDKYRLTLDNEVTLDLFDDVILKNNVLYKKEISDDLLESINKENDYYFYYNKALKYISVKLRSTKELINYLDKFELNELEKNKIMDKLKNIGLINDYMFAKAYINDKIYLSNNGPYKIKKELLEHDIEECVIDDLLNELDKDLVNEKIRKIINKKINSNKNLSSYKLKSKIINDLVNMGYDKELIINELEMVEISEDKNILESEFNKIYKKLSKKYQGSELRFNLVGKLMQKGFSKSEIEEVLGSKDF